MSLIDSKNQRILLSSGIIDAMTQQSIGIHSYYEIKSKTGCENKHCALANTGIEALPFVYGVNPRITKAPGFTAMAAKRRLLF